MRFFTCYTRLDQREVPIAWFVFAASFERVRELARREMQRTRHATSVDIFGPEGGFRGTVARS